MKYLMMKVQTYYHSSYIDYENNYINYFGASAFTNTYPKLRRNLKAVKFENLYLNRGELFRKYQVIN